MFVIIDTIVTVALLAIVALVWYVWKHRKRPDKWAVRAKLERKERIGKLKAGERQYGKGSNL